MAFRSQLDDFAALYERTYPGLFRTVLGICGDAAMAADVTQDAYAQAYRQRSSFRGDVPVDAWLHRIAVNAALTGLRRRKVRWTEPLGPVRHEQPGRASDASAAIDLESALARLEPRQRADGAVLRTYDETRRQAGSRAWMSGNRAGPAGPGLLGSAADRLLGEMALHRGLA